MDGRVDHHRLLPRAYIVDLEIHVEEVTVAFLHSLVTQTLDGVGEVKEHRETCLIDSESGVASLLGGS